ncbi:curli production assembly/transport protein CsgE [Shewanella donghaensis]|uniref:curli production assembly/transport protein CsgE n=1 Tax=Shewanella donghaensis TaxID=238836 RepID=UPI001D04F35D|nr:curli production assembly/transport protein CsgE [Shewanella donghaensis]
MKNIIVMFFLLLFPSTVFAESQIAAETSVTEVPIKQSNSKNEAPIDQSQVDKLDNAKEPATSATDKNIQKAPALKPLDISDAIPKNEKDLIDGLILNRAMTRLGHRFYRQFVGAYRDIGGNSKHSGLTVVEQATARSGSKILIQQNRKTIFVTFISPISRNMDDQVNYAAKRVNAAVIKKNEQAILGALFDPDLAPDEI